MIGLAQPTLARLVSSGLQRGVCVCVCECVRGREGGRG